MTADPSRLPAGTPAAPVALSAAETSRRRAIRRKLIARCVAGGNANALRHGVYSVVAIHEDVLDEVSLLFAGAPHLDPIRDGRLVEATGRLIVRLRKLDAALDLAPTSRELSSMSSRLEAQLTRNLAELGLTPRAAHDLGLPERHAATSAQRYSQETLARYQQPPAPAGKPTKQETDDAD
jgi:hypothetical protein